MELERKGDFPWSTFPGWAPLKVLERNAFGIQLGWYRELIGSSLGGTGLFFFEPKTKKEEIKMQGNCVVCDANIVLDDNIVVGEVICCPDCGTELEVLSIQPVELAEAPEVEEDWGE